MYIKNMMMIIMIKYHNKALLNNMTLQPQIDNLNKNN